MKPTQPSMAKAFRIKSIDRWHPAPVTKLKGSNAPRTKHPIHYRFYTGVNGICAYYRSSWQNRTDTLFFVVIGAATDAVSAFVFVDGFFLVDNLEISSPLGEYVPTQQGVEEAKFELPLVINNANVFTIQQRLHSVTVDENCVHNVSYTWVTARQIEIVQTGAGGTLQPPLPQNCLYFPYR